VTSRRQHVILLQGHSKVKVNPKGTYKVNVMGPWGLKDIDTTDHSAEEQFGLVWTEVIMFGKCNYRSKRYNLYTEIVTGKQRKSPTAINSGFCVDLTQTPIGPSDETFLLATFLPPVEVACRKHPTLPAEALKEQTMKTWECGGSS